jgi:signal transduction histidine kinase
MTSTEAPGTSWFFRLVQWLRPTAPLAVLATFRVRMVVACSLVVAAVTAVLAALTVYEQHWLSAALMTSLCAMTLLVLVLLRTRLTVEAVIRTQLTLAAALMAVITMQTQRLPIEILYWLSMLPMLASLLLGRREARFAAVGAMALGLALAALHRTSWRITDNPEVVTGPKPVVSFVLFVLSTLQIAQLSERVRARALAEAEAAGRARSLFLANVSHELRTPLNGVIGMAELLARSPLDGARAGQVEVIRQSGEVLVSLIDDLLDLTRIESGLLALEVVPMAPRALVAEVAALFAPLAAQKGVALQAACDPSVPDSLAGDPLRVRQVLMNLVANAVKFTDAGSVTVEARWRDGLVVGVRDTGIGMTADALARLFQPFAQGDATTTRRFGGTGLGLALCRQLCVRMGGDVRVASTPGVGTYFEVSLPLPVAPSASAPPAPARASLPPTSAKGSQRVLVVEDNAINQMVVGAMLEQLGLAFDAVNDGAAAVEAAARGGYQLVLMDCQMPVMDGFAATEAIRALPGAQGRVPIVALTASALPDELARCLACGMNATLSKPLTFADLDAALARYA